MAPTDTELDQAPSDADCVAIARSAAATIDKMYTLMMHRMIRDGPQDKEKRKRFAERFDQLVQLQAGMREDAATL